MSKKLFRFSLQSFNTDSPANWRKLIAKTEDLGYSTFFLADHFLSAGPALDSTYHPPQMLAAVPAIAMALEQTSTPAHSPPNSMRRRSHAEQVHLRPGQGDVAGRA